MISTFEYFDLPKGYMKGVGHFPNWGKDSNDNAAKKKRAATQKKGAGAAAKNSKLAKLRKERGLDKEKEEDIKPTHFDIAVFLKVFKRFVACNGEIRSEMRRALLKDI